MNRNFSPTGVPAGSHTDIRGGTTSLDEHAAYDHLALPGQTAETDECAPNCWCCEQEKAHCVTKTPESGRDTSDAITPSVADRFYRLDAEDQRWLTDFGSFIRSHTAFVLAEFGHDERMLNEAATEVLVWHKGGFTSIAELIRDCESHRCGGLVYEAWAWETATRVHALVNHLDLIPAVALIHHAKRLDWFDIDTAAMLQALDEARRALYGEGAYI